MQDNYFREIPHNWDISKFGDLAKITCGIAATPEYVDATVGVPFLSARNVQNGRLDLKYFQYIPIELHKKLTKNTKPQKGDILLTRVGAGIGDAAVVNIDFDFSIYVSLTLIKCGKKLDSEFVTLLLRTSYYRYLATRDQFAGGGVQNLNVQMVKEYPIIVPPLAEQQKIAQILSTWDKAIAVTEQLLANSQQQKKALMQQLLTGKKRLLDENGVRFEGEWEEVLLGDIAKITTGSSNRQDSNLNGEYTFFDRSEDIRTSNIYLFDCEAVIVPGEGQDFVPKYFVGKFDLHQRTYAIMDFISHDGKFLFYAIHYFRSYFLSQAVGSTVKSLRLPMFQKMKISLPELAEQQKIAKVLSTADQEIEALQRKLDGLQQEKKALMQQLLTGKRRVKVAA